MLRKQEVQGGPVVGEIGSAVQGRGAIDVQLLGSSAVLSASFTVAAVGAAES